MKKLNLIIGLVTISLANLASANVLYWDGGTSDIATNGDGISQGAAGTWNTTIQNWDQGAAPHVAWIGGADAVFGQTGITAGSGIVSLGAAITANSITITSTNYLINDGGSAANTLTLNSVTNSAVLTIGANIINSAGLAKSGASTLSLTNASAGLTGPITVNSGTLKLGDASAFNGPTGFGNVSVATNAAFQISDAVSASYAQAISGEGSVVVQNKSSSIVTTLTGASTHSGGTVVAQATLTVSSLDESGPNPLGTGFLQIANNSSATAFTYGFPGGDVTTSRPLIFGGNASPTINNSSSGTLTLAGPISFAANATAAKTINLGGNMPVIVASVIPDNITPTTTNRTSLLVRNTGGYWMLTASNTFSGGIQFYGGGSGAYTLVITNDAGLGNVTNTITCTTNGSTASACSGEIDSTNFPVTLAATRTFTFTGPNSQGMPAMVFKTVDTNSLTVASYITGAGNVKRKSSPGLTDGVAGAVRFSNDANDFSGSFSAEIGATEFTSVANSGTPCSLGTGMTNSGIITLNNASSAEVFRYVGNGASTTTRALNWTGTTGNLALDASGGGTVEFLATGSLKSGSGSANLNLQGTNAGNNALAQVINDSGGITTLSKSGPGKWVLTGANTYSGPTTVSDGTLSVSSDANLGAAPGSATPNSLTINSAALSASASFTLNANRGIALGPTGTNSLGDNASGNGTIDVAGGQTLSYGGIIANTTATNTGGLSKTSGGTLTLSGANTYTGDTAVHGGTLALAGSGSIAASTNIVLYSGTALDVSGVGGGYTLAAGQTLVASNGINVIIGGSLNLGSAAVAMTSVVVTPTITVTNGTLTLASGNAFTVNVNNGGIGLGAGSYLLVAKGTGGSVAGTAPASVMVGGDGLVGGATASLSISNSELYLVVSGGTLYPPNINGFNLVGGQAVLSFSGTNGQSWKILTSTNLTVPLTNWVTLTTGTFAGAVVNYTNASLVEPERFYIITSP